MSIGQIIGIVIACLFILLILSMLVSYIVFEIKAKKNKYF